MSPALERARRAASCLWLERTRGLIGRHGRLLRVTGAMLATLFLMSFAVVNYEALVAQEAGAGIAIDDLSRYPTHLTVDGFDVELTNLSSAVAYEVVVSSDSANVGIGGCGTASQTETVTGVAATELRFAVYACAVGEATVTAEVRRAGASSAEASVSEQLQVEALPEIVIGPTGERIRTTTTQGVSGQGTAETAAQAPREGTPGIVPNIRFHDITSKSVHVTWDLPSNGGPKLTGYGLLFWPGAVDDQPGWETALVKGTWPRNHDYRGLQSGKTYNFRIHACNARGSCGYWTNPPKTVEIPLPEDPGPVTNLQHTRNNGSVTLTWTAPTKSGSGKLTGYHVQHKESGGTWPIGAAVVTPATRTRWTGNLSSGTAHDVRVQACNGDSLCSDWVERAIPGGTGPPPITAAPAPGNLTAGTVTDTSVPLSWDAVANATKYRVEYRESGTTAWTTHNDSLTSRSHTVDQLNCGTAYQFAVSAHGDGTNHLAQWGARATTSATTSATADDCTPPPEMMGPPTTRTYSVTGSCPATQVAPIDSLAAKPPVIVDFTPLAAREAALCWVPVVLATQYEVQAAKYATPSPPTADADWITIATLDVKASDLVTNTTPTNPVMEKLDLDKFYAVSGAAMQGLGDHPAYWIRVRATNGTKTTSPTLRSPYSQPIIIIDTPVLVANGDSRGASRGPGQAQLTWSSIHSDSILGKSYPSGSYHIRYRLAIDHDSDAWTQNNLSDSISETPSVSNSHTIGGLDLSALYAIQVVYDKTGATDIADVYSARYSYVWTSITPPLAGDRIAGIPFKYPLSTVNNTFEYRICSETFPSDKRTAWIHVIRHALRQWNIATDDLVNVVHAVYTERDFEPDVKPGDGKPCIDFVTLVNDLAASIRAILENEVGLPIARLQDDIKNSVRMLVNNGMYARQDGELRLNEIKMYDDSPGNFAFLADELEHIDVTLGVMGRLHIIGFGQLSPFLGHSWCWDPDPHTGVVASACAAYDGRYETTDIFVRRTAIRNDSLAIPNKDGGVLIGPVEKNYGTEHGDVVFNVCRGHPNQNRAYGMLVHEVGHALGLRGGQKHTVEKDSVMKAGYESDSCSPHPLDIMAVYALYQSR